MEWQYPIRVGKREFFIDLLFYNVKLHCYFVVELKTVEFEPEFAGKLSFYLSAVRDFVGICFDFGTYVETVVLLSKP